MFTKFSIVLAALATLVVAIPTSGPAVSQCNTGSVQCCNSVQDAKTEGVSSLLDLLSLQGVTGAVGLGCTDVIGATSCTQQPVCCENNSFNGLVNIGCTPISL